MNKLIHNFSISDEGNSTAPDRQKSVCCLASKCDLLSVHVKPGTLNGIIKKGGKR